MTRTWYLSALNPSILFHLRLYTNQLTLHTTLYARLCRFYKGDRRLKELYTVNKKTSKVLKVRFFFAIFAIV